MNQEPFTVQGPGYQLAGLLDLPASKPPWRPVIITHGLFSTKDSEKHLRSAQALSRLGLAAARFDCQGCGQSGGRIERTTLTGRAEEIRAVRDLLLEDPRLSGRPLLWGSSFGGSASLLLAAREGDFKGVVTWSAPLDFRALEDRREELEYPMEQSFFDDLESLDLVVELKGLGPCLVVHGEEDELVPLAQAEALARTLGPPCRLVILHGADHSLTTSGAADLALAESLAWVEDLCPENLDQAAD